MCGAQHASFVVKLRSASLLPRARGINPFTPKFYSRRRSIALVGPVHVPHACVAHKKIIPLGRAVDREYSDLSKAAERFQSPLFYVFHAA